MHSRRYLHVIAVGLCIGTYVWPVLTHGKTHQKRKVIAFYDNKVVKKLSESPTHLYAEFPLNHVGLEVIHWPVSVPLPTQDDLKEVTGILTWFQREGAVPNSKLFCDWLSKQMSQGKKVVIMDNPGFFHGPKKNLLSASCKKMLKTLGVTYGKESYDNPFLLNITTTDKEIVGFERKRNLIDPIEYISLSASRDDVRTHFGVSIKNEPESESSLVMTSPRGGLAYTHALQYHNKAINSPVWYLNPFKFFELAYGLKGWPRPDTNMINGRRIGYNHIDGDGIFNPTPNKSFSGHVILEEVLKKYNTMPFTASYITAYFKIKKYNNTEIDALYAGISSLPNIEIASHTFAHPLKWDPKNKRGIDPYELAVPYSGYAYDDHRETVGSINDVNELHKRLGIDKKASLLLWSGDCDPAEKTLSVMDPDSFLNMNGGDTLSDAKHPGISHIAPLSILKGKHRQIYSSNTNEMLYLDKGFESYFGGFKKVIDTFKNTGAPNLYKPVNIYFHYYIASQHAGMRALHKAISYALDQNLFFMFASDYAHIAKDFFKTDIHKTASGSFVIENSGKLRTIRFDREDKHVNMARSKGVIGYKHHQNDLYVFLDEKRSHEIILSATAPSKPYIREATFHISNFKSSKSLISFNKQGWHKSEAQLSGLVPNSTYTIKTKHTSQKQKATAQGVLSVQFKHSEQGQSATAVRIEANAK